VSADDAEVWASHSSLVAHRHCPQKWHYGSVRKLEKVDPADVAVERDFGSWWHMLRAADSISRGRDLGCLQVLPASLSAVDDGPVLEGKALEKIEPIDVIALALDWWRAQPAHVHEMWTERIKDGLPVRLDRLNRKWRKQWGPDMEFEQPLAAELRWERDLPALPGPHDTVTNPKVRLVGYVDEVYYDSRRHMVVVRDHKAHKQLSTQTTADDMMDSQLQLYAWGASPQVREWDVGRISATAYDRVRMVRPTTPVVTQMGSLSKSVTDYDLETYLEWCASKPAFPGRAKDGSQAGTYQLEQVVAEKLRSPSATSIWLQRTLTPLNTNIIRSHLRAAVDSATDMAVTRARAEVTGEAARNFGNGCRWCDFVRLCRAEMVGGVGGDYDLDDMRLRPRTERR
jgi:hypothetical protein